MGVEKKENEQAEGCHLYHGATELGDHGTVGTSQSWRVFCSTAQGSGWTLRKQMMYKIPLEIITIT